MFTEESIITKLEKKEIEIERQIKELENKKRESSRKASECQVQIVGLTGELNMLKEIIQELKRTNKE